MARRLRQTSCDGRAWLALGTHQAHQVHHKPTTSPSRVGLPSSAVHTPGRMWYAVQVPLPHAGMPMSKTGNVVISHAPSHRTCP